MAILTVTAVTTAGALINGAGLTAAAGGGDSFVNTGREYLVVNNASGGSITVTFSSNGAGAVCSFGKTSTAHDEGGAVAAGATRVFGPFKPAQFNDSNGRVQVTYSGVTSLTVNPFSFPNAG